jgi:hypothetical protein
MKIEIFLFVSCISLLAQAVLSPSPQAGVTNDPLVVYQWGLQSNGQKVRRDKTDITHWDLEPSPYADIQADPVALTLKMKKDIVVAVLDSGIDYRHPDLLENLKFNLSECQQGEIPFQPKADKDQNGFPGDCLGWNFTAPPGDSNQNNPDDDLGHGTHVSGIIAAGVNNRLGVSGVSGHIRILPLKVTSAADNSASLSTLESARMLTDRVEAALKYANLMKADVINISLGWPAAADRATLRALVKQMARNGTTFVVAAGNNNNTSLNFPCSYPEVICVGAHGIDGATTEFSNFGGAVDLSAPGEEIVSTYPTSLDSTRLSLRGYQSLDGTSQATPFVSAAVAVLKGIMPSISELEIKARLFKTAKPLSKNSYEGSQKFLQFGGVRVQDALNLLDCNFVAPVFKNLSQLNFSQGHSEISFRVDVQNYAAQAAEALIKIESMSPQLKLKNSDFRTLKFQPGQLLQIPILGDLVSEDRDKEVKIKVTVKTSDEDAREYFQNLTLTRNLKWDPKLRKLPIQLLAGSQAPQAVLSITDKLGLDENPSYFWTESLPNQEIKVHFLETTDGAYTEISRPLPSSQRLLNLLKLQAGSLQGYWVGTLGKSRDGKALAFHYTYLDKKNQNSSMDVQYLPAEFVLDKDAVDSLQFLTKAVGGLEVVMPVLTTSSLIPAMDLNPDKTVYETNESRRRVMYLEPIAASGGLSYQARNFDNFEFRSRLRRELRLTFQEDLNLVGILPRPRGESGVVRILYGYGSEALQKYVVIESNSEQLMRHEFSVRPASFSSTFLSYGVMAPVTDLTGYPIPSSAASFAAFLTPTQAQNMILAPNGLKQEAQMTTQSARPSDLLISYLQTYSKATSFYSFLQSKSELIVHQQGLAGVSRIQQVPIHRATWQGINATETMAPVQIKANNSWSPAIFVDATSMYTDSVYFWTLNGEDDLLSPARLSLQVPSGCRPLAPQSFRILGGATAQVFYCVEDSGPSLKILELN